VFKAIVTPPNGNPEEFPIRDLVHLKGFHVLVPLSSYPADTKVEYQMDGYEGSFTNPNDAFMLQLTKI
jgi:hypothetical protein